MNLLCIGINHRTAPIEVRESVWFSNDEIQRILPQLKEKYFGECVLVSTCNRTEMYGISTENNFSEEKPKKFLIQYKDARPVARPEHFYVLHSLGAVRHLFNVTSGIDSMVLGDVQILNQMKEAFEVARQAQTLGTVLTKLFHSAFHSGKRSRTETEISEGAVSISYAAVELAGKIFDDLSQRKALLIGAGDTGKLTAKHLLGKRIGNLFLANRTRERAEEIAALLGGTVVDVEAIPTLMHEVDIVITAVSAPGTILTARDVHAVMKHRANRPLCIIDIGVPRNVDPQANKIGSVFLHDIDALSRIVDRNLEKRRAEVPKVQRIVYEELVKFHQWYTSLQVAPTIQQLREQFESIRQEEVEKAVNRFSPEQRESVEIITKRIINKILHTPMISLKDGADGEESEETLKKISTIRSLFGLEAKTEKGKKRPNSDEEQ